MKPGFLRALPLEQRGSALLVALVILTLTMLVGVASLKQSLMQSKIAANTNASGIAFQAADNAVESVIAEVMNNKTIAGTQSTLMSDLAKFYSVKQCVGGEDSASKCARLAGSGLVRAGSLTRREEIPERPVTGSSTNTVVWRFYKVTGTGSLGANADVEVSNEQQFARRENAANDGVYRERGNSTGGGQANGT